MHEGNTKTQPIAEINKCYGENKACGSRREYPGGSQGRFRGRDAGGKDCMNCRRIFPDKEG